MVLEKLSQLQFSEKIFVEGFLKGFLFCIFGALIGFMFFPSNALLIGIFFSTIALMPSVNKVLSLQELLEGRVKKIGGGKEVELSELSLSSQEINPVSLLKENFSLFKFYLGIFFGMIVFFLILFFILPESSVESLSYQIRFGTRLSTVEEGIGNAWGASIGFSAYDSSFFFDYLSNNSVVLLVAFIIALLFGEGAIFIVSWNAAFWASVFVLKAKSMALLAGADPVLLILLIFASVLIHMGLETLSYLMAIMSGGIINKAFSREKMHGERFPKILVHALIILFSAFLVVAFAAWWESSITPIVIQTLVPNY